MSIIASRAGLQPLHVLRVLLCACAVGAGLQVLPLAAPAAYASIGPCGSDPLFLLSNGTELDVNTIIADDSADVRQAVFTIHVPVGTSVVLYVAGALGTRESWQVFADEEPGNYTTITRVSAFTPGISVQATTQAIGLIGAPLAMVAGQVDQNLTAHVTLY